MTAPVFTPISDPLYALCPECRAMETLDAATGRCRLCWRAWRWSPVGWARDWSKGPCMLSVSGGPKEGGEIRCSCGEHAELTVITEGTSAGMFCLAWRVENAGPPLEPAELQRRVKAALARLEKPDPGIKPRGP